MFCSIPETDQSVPLKIVRCGTGKSFRTIIACSEMRGVLTHYVNSQTIVCQSGPACPGCERNMVPRWQGFTIVSSEDQGQYGLLQFTPPVATQLERHSKRNSGLLGLDITLSRLGRRLNSPLMVKINGEALVHQAWAPKQLENCLRRLFSQVKNLPIHSRPVA